MNEVSTRQPIAIRKGENTKYRIAFAVVLWHSLDDRIDSNLRQMWEVYPMPCLRDISTSNRIIFFGITSQLYQSGGRSPDSRR